MSAFGAAVATELRKAAASRVFRTVTVLLVVGLALLVGSLLAAAGAGNALIRARLGPLADAEGWDLLTGVVVQITSAGGLGAFGIALSWMFGREFADGTVTGLFALPVPRTVIAAAKLLVYLGWAIAVAVVLTGSTTVLGLVLGYGWPDAAGTTALARLGALTVFSALLAIPAGWAATVGRGLLPGIGMTIGIIVVAQVGVISGAGGWTPFAAPALWALGLEPVTVVQLLVSLVVPACAAFAIAWAWARLQLDR